MVMSPQVRDDSLYRKAMHFLLLRISRVLAFALLSLSLLLPWFRVPISVRENLNGVYTVVFSEPVSTTIFKIVVLAVLLSACWLGYRRRHAGSTNWTSPMAVSGCILLAVLGIAYPAMTM